jgi:hypothetical protein
MEILKCPSDIEWKHNLPQYGGGVVAQAEVFRHFHSLVSFSPLFASLYVSELLIRMHNVPKNLIRQNTYLTK